MLASPAAGGWGSVSFNSEGGAFYLREVVSVFFIYRNQIKVRVFKSKSSYSQVHFWKGWNVRTSHKILGRNQQLRPIPQMAQQDQPLPIFSSAVPLLLSSWVMTSQEAFVSHSHGEAGRGGPLRVLPRRVERGVAHCKGAAPGGTCYLHHQTTQPAADDWKSVAGSRKGGSGHSRAPCFPLCV